MSSALIILLTSFVATALSSMSGGGASVIIIPVMLWLGISFPMATAAQKVSSVFWVLPASYNYLHDRKVDWLFLLIYAVIGLVGVYVGFSVVLSLDPKLVKIIVGTLILLLALYVWASPTLGKASDKTTSAQNLIAYVSAPFLGFYEVFFGSGNGILFSMVTIRSWGFDFVSSLGHYYAVAFFWEVVAVAMFIHRGIFNFDVILPTVIGSLAGGWIGSRYGKFKGNAFIRAMFVLMATIIGTKLLFGF